MKQIDVLDGASFAKPCTKKRENQVSELVQHALFHFPSCFKAYKIDEITHV